VNCPSEIAAILREILRTAVLRIRAAGWQGDARRCAAEADHVHNLPGLLGDYAEDLLDYYWRVERPAFIDRAGTEAAAAYDPLWERLAGHVPTTAPK
jgi:hypothetical protein